MNLLYNKDTYIVFPCRPMYNYINRLKLKYKIIMSYSLNNINKKKKLLLIRFVRITNVEFENNPFIDKETVSVNLNIFLHNNSFNVTIKIVCCTDV